MRVFFVKKLSFPPPKKDNPLGNHQPLKKPKKHINPLDFGKKTPCYCKSQINGIFLSISKRWVKEFSLKPGSFVP